MDQLMALLAGNDVSVPRAEIEKRAIERGFNPDKLTAPQIHELLTEYLPTPGSGTLATAQPKAIKGKGNGRKTKGMPDAKTGLTKVVSEVSQEIAAFEEELETGRQLWIDDRTQRIAARLAGTSRDLVESVNAELSNYAGDAEFFRSEARKLSYATWGFSGGDEAE